MSLKFVLSYLEVGPRSIEVLISNGGKIRRMAEILRGKSCWWVITDKKLYKSSSISEITTRINAAMGPKVLVPELKIR